MKKTAERIETIENPREVVLLECLDYLNISIGRRVLDMVSATTNGFTVEKYGDIHEFNKRGNSLFKTLGEPESVNLVNFDGIVDYASDLWEDKIYLIYDPLHRFETPKYNPAKDITLYQNDTNIILGKVFKKKVSEDLKQRAKRQKQRFEEICNDAMNNITQEGLDIFKKELDKLPLFFMMFKPNLIEEFESLIDMKKWIENWEEMTK